eukprot:9018164-Pyramimonas_sp.AAC.1
MGDLVGPNRPCRIQETSSRADAGAQTRNRRCDDDDVVPSRICRQDKGHGVFAASPTSPPVNFVRRGKPKDTGAWRGTRQDPPTTPVRFQKRDRDLSCAKFGEGADRGL